MSTLVATILGAVLTAAVLVWYRVLARAARRPEPPRRALSHYPSVTVIRPVKGADVGARENFAAALDLDYPGEVETLFIFDDASDPGYAIAREVVEEHRRSGKPGRADVLTSGPPPPARTGKLHAMILGVARASGSLIAFGDSDTRPARDLLRTLVETLMSTPRAGSAFAPVAVTEPPRAAGDVLYALMQNALYSPLAARAAGTTGELPYIMGQLMVWKREALDAIGGLECATGQLVDDMYLGRRLAAAGYKNIQVKQPLTIITGGLTLRDFIPVYARWLAFARNGLEWRLTWPDWLVGAATWIAATLVTAALRHEQPLAALMPALALVTVAFALFRLNRLYGGARVPLRYCWTPLALILLVPLMVASYQLRRRVEWRGRVYEINRNAALAA